MILPICIPPVANIEYNGHSGVLDHAVIPWDLLGMEMLELTQQTQPFSLQWPFVPIPKLALDHTSDFCHLGP